VFLCEVAHLAETATRPNIREASSSSAGFYGFHDNESDNDTESASKVEGLQFLSDPSHNVDWFLPKKKFAAKIAAQQLKFVKLLEPQNARSVSHSNR